MPRLRRKRTKFHPMTKRRAYACQECGHHIYPCAGTIFHKSRTKLTKWFFAMYLMTSTRHGVAAKEIERQTRRHLQMRLAHVPRTAQAHGQGGRTIRRRPASGHVEIDETLVGGGRRQGATSAKTRPIVFGMVERDGKIVAGPIPDATNYT